jgi:mycofactocin precursor
VNLKRFKIISKSPERVNSFPPFGGLFFMTIYPNITSPKSRFNQFKTGRKIMSDKYVENKEELQQSANEEQNEKITSDIYSIREIEIEEMAIDGICGVY